MPLKLAKSNAAGFWYEIPVKGETYYFPGRTGFEAQVGKDEFFVTTHATVILTKEEWKKRKGYAAVREARENAEKQYQDSAIQQVVKSKYDQRMDEGSAAAGIPRSIYETLHQLAKGPIWDGNLISKTDRDQVVRTGLCDRTLGWNFLTNAGVTACVNYGILRA